jgi:hypothetical protein
MGMEASAMRGVCCCGAARLGLRPGASLRGLVASAGSRSPRCSVRPGPAMLYGSSLHLSPMTTCREVTGPCQPHVNQKKGQTTPTCTSTVTGALLGTAVQAS